MFVVLVTDFANVQEVYGPFDSREAAHEWGEQVVRDVYRVIEVSAPDEVPVTVARQQSD